MPRLKRKSHHTNRQQIKTKKRKIKEESKKLQELQLINQMDCNEESNASQINKTEEHSEDQPELSRIEKHAEYVRNYRKNMSEERKRAARAIAAWRMAQRRKNMSEEEKLAQREYHRQRMAFKRQNMSEEQKLAAREADRRRVAMKRKKWKEQSEHFRAAMLRLGLQRPNLLPPPVDLTDSTSDDDAPEDIQRFLAITLVTGRTITSN